MHPLVSLAKEAVEKYIKTGQVIAPKALPDEFLSKKSGTFVTIKKNNKLRGCIGTYLPNKDNIAQEVISNAIAAASKDYRFGKIKKEELNQLSYTVYILSNPEPVKSLDQLDPNQYGIIVKSENSNEDVVFNGHKSAKTGVLLPDLNGIDTPEKQLVAACQKAGVSKQEKIKVWRFKTKKYD